MTKSEAGRVQPEAGDGTSPLKLSVIVPVYNSSAELARCLESLAVSMSTNSPDVEVFVVDDGSTEPIEPIVAAHGFTYVRVEGPGGPARARNHGASKVAGTHLVFVDADVCVHADTLSRMAQAFDEDSSLDAIIGSYDESPADQAFLSQYKNIFHHFVHQANDGDVSTFWSGCGAIRRDLFLAFGGFDEKRYERPAIEDIELGTWLSAAGHRIVLDRRIKCKHLKRWTLLGLLKSDILDRGVPWTRLMLRAGAVANTLNLRSAQKLSVALAYLTPILAVAGIWWRPAWVAAALGAVAVTVLNIEFYRYFLRRKGALFTARVVPMHWLYFWYCGVSVVLGGLLHFFKDRPGRTSPPAGRSAADARG